MEAESCLSEKCSKCGGLFDLKYDVEVMERDLSREEAFERVVCELKNKEGVLCWDCRAV